MSAKKSASGTFRKNVFTSFGALTKSPRFTVSTRAQSNFHRAVFECGSTEWVRADWSCTEECWNHASSGRDSSRTEGRTEHDERPAKESGNVSGDRRRSETWHVLRPCCIKARSGICVALGRSALCGCQPRPPRSHNRILIPSARWKNMRTSAHSCWSWYAWLRFGMTDTVNQGYGSPCWRCCSRERRTLASYPKWYPDHGSLQRARVLWRW